MHAGSGVSTDVWTCYAARIMVLSIVPIVIVQLPNVLNTTSISRVTVLISLIVSISLVFAYSIYQVAKAIIMNGRQNLFFFFDKSKSYLLTAELCISFHHQARPAEHYLWILLQVFQPWIQKRRIEYAKQKQLISGILKLVKMHALGRLFTDDGEPNIDVIQKLAMLNLNEFITVHHFTK